MVHPRLDWRQEAQAMESDCGQDGWRRAKRPRGVGSDILGTSQSNLAGRNTSPRASSTSRCSGVKLGIRRVLAELDRSHGCRRES